jgi:peptide/nickel transport system substrate-binding protein
MKLVYVLVGFGMCLLSACHQPAPQSEPGIVFAVAQAPLNLDPRYATDAASARVNRLLYRALIDFDAQSKPVADLATWQKISPSQYRFTLIQPVPKFHDGSVLDAGDVAVTYDSIRQLKDSAHTAEFANIARIAVIDAGTLDFYLTQPDPHFVAKLIIGILPATWLVGGQDFSHAPIGNGPLKFLSWHHQLVLERTADQQRISLLEVKDPTVRVLKLLNAEVDLVQGDLPPELLKYLQTKPGLVVKRSVGSNFSYMGLNFEDVQLKKGLVRQALAHAIDRQAILKQALVDGSRLATVILPPEHYTNQNREPSDYPLATYDYNPQLARQLLLQASVSLPLKLVYKTSTDAQRVRLATILQAQMQPAGINLEIHSLDWGTFFEDIKHGNFQLYGLTWVGIKTPEIYAQAFATQSLPPLGFNRGRYADKHLDQLLADEDWPAATAYMQQQLPVVPLWYEGQFAAMRNNITQYSPKPDGNWDDLATISNHAH